MDHIITCLLIVQKVYLFNKHSSTKTEEKGIDHSVYNSVNTEDIISILHEYKLSLS